MGVQVTLNGKQRKRSDEAAETRVGGARPLNVGRGIHAGKANT